jgi:moderate conductance mechanosensitive channel
MPNTLVHLPAWVQTIVLIAAVIGVTVALTWIVRRLAARFVNRVTQANVQAPLERAKRAQTVGSVLRAAATALLWVIATLIVLSQIGLNIAPLLTAAGVGGIALGFGAQNVVRDFLAGLFILLEDQYHVGDIVQIAGVDGMVEKITLRTTTLRDLEGVVHVVANGEIRVSSNRTKGYSRYVIDLPVPYDEDIDRVSDIARHVADEMRKEEQFANQILGPLEVLGIDAYGPVYATLKTYIDTRPGEQYTIGRELRGRILAACEAADITIAGPEAVAVVSKTKDR